MPQLKLNVLYATLNGLQIRLYNIYLATNDLGLSDAILAERNYVLGIMTQIKSLL